MSELMIKDSGMIARAELDVQISTAKAYPRDITRSLNNMISMATFDQETAESCFYALVRNGKEGKSEIKGPSIRLAEIVISCWGNIHFATRIIENDGKFITAQAVVWDLENNVRGGDEVKRSIQYKNGGTYSADMQVVTGQAASSIALRNAIIKVVGRSNVNLVYKAAQLAAVGDQKTLDSRRKTVFERFNKMGIETSRILSFFNKASIDEFTAEDIADLIGVGTSIKEGLLSIDKAFAVDHHDQENSVEEKLKTLLRDKA